MALPKEKTWDSTLSYVDRLHKKMCALEATLDTLKERRFVDPRFANQTCPDCGEKGYFSVVHEYQGEANSVKCEICGEVHRVCQMMGCQEILSDDNCINGGDICDECHDRAKADIDWEPEEEPKMPPLPGRLGEL